MLKLFKVLGEKNTNILGHDMKCSYGRRTTRDKEKALHLELSDKNQLIRNFECIKQKRKLPQFCQFESNQWKSQKYLLYVYFYQHSIKHIH